MPVTRGKQAESKGCSQRLTCPLNGLHKLHQERGSHIRWGKLLRQVRECGAW